MLDNFAERIEDYEVYELLGKGGFASVYRAKCQRTGLCVAIKMIDKKLMQSAGMANRVRQEVSIHSRLKHPSILELFTFFEDVNHVYLVLELAENGELQRYLRETKKTFNEYEAASVLKQVVDGLLYLHSNHILHRDMSLANLLLTKQMTIKISDFGLATQLSRPDEKHMTLCGTPNYISPEVASRASHGLPADVWGLGCMLYTFLVGRPPFDTDGVKSTLTKVVMSGYVIPSHISQEAQDLIDRLLKKNPAERIKLNDVLQHPFMRKANPLDKNHSNTLASTDSGIHTISSGATRSNFSQDRGYPPNQMPLRYQPISEHEQDFQESVLLPRPQSAVQQPKQTSDFFSGYSQQEPRYGLPPVSHQQQLQLNQISLLQQFNSMELMEKYNINKAEIVSVGRSASTGSSGLLQPQFSQQQQQHPQISLLNSRPKSASISMLYHISAEAQHSKRHDGGKENVAANSGTRENYGGTPPVQTVGHDFLDRFQPRNNHHQPPTSPRHSPMKPPRKRLEIPPLNTARLLPNRHKTKNAILSIQPGGEVVLEFIKHKARYREDRVVDVCRISADGLRFVLYHPGDGGKGVSVKDEPPDLPPGGADSIFSYESLPEKHWKKYMYAARFVQMVQAKTPKITYYSDRAKCQLMETLEDFEACFYSGTKIVKSTQEGTKIVDSYGSTVKDLTNLNASLSHDYNHFKLSFEHCLNIERALSTVNSGNTFPLIIGRRPTSGTSAGITKANHLLSNISAPQTPMTPSQLPSFAMSVNSQSSQQHKRPVLSVKPPSHNFSNVAVKKCAIPGIGVAVELSQGVIQVQFADGAALALIPLEQGGGVTFSPGPGSPLQHYATAEQDDLLPPLLREKIELMPTVLRELHAAPAPSIPFNFLGGSSGDSPRTPLTRFLR
ncbi:serine/threonine-protein kinase PLK4 [Uranotaenia lowii]|uniref:serine/threonine-protein kinase PLK4 n=1 Tax=Uranotaenia lowii TaxID=190385 RepID=UPI0024794DD0|nr:serine/threonine-protein kinase PLK4 [Uranotaenia lowii]